MNMYPLFVLRFGDIRKYRIKVVAGDQWRLSEVSSDGLSSKFFNPIEAPEAELAA